LVAILIASGKVAGSGPCDVGAVGVTDQRGLRRGRLHSVEISQELSQPRPSVQRRLLARSRHQALRRVVVEPHHHGCTRARLLPDQVAAIRLPAQRVQAVAHPRDQHRDVPRLAELAEHLDRPALAVGIHLEELT
jgi:hypothetical protein